MHNVQYCSVCNKSMHAQNPQNNGFRFVSAFVRGQVSADCWYSVRANDLHLNTAGGSHDFVRISRSDCLVQMLNFGIHFWEFMYLGYTACNQGFCSFCALRSTCTQIPQVVFRDFVRSSRSDGMFAARFHCNLSKMVCWDSLLKAYLLVSAGTLVVSVFYREQYLHSVCACGCEAYLLFWPSKTFAPI